MAATSEFSDPVFHILLALADRPRHGYAITVEIEERTDGLVCLGTGTLYTALKRLRSEELIEEVADPAGVSDARGRRTYGLTPRGRVALAEQSKRLRALVDHAVAKRILRGYRSA